MSVSQEFICKCGEMKVWIAEDKQTSPCPKCGKSYVGKYNPKKLRIDAIEVDNDGKIIKENRYIWKSIKKAVKKIF